MKNGKLTALRRILQLDETFCNSDLFNSYCRCLDSW